MYNYVAMAAGRGDSDSGVGTMTTSGDADVTVEDVYLRISVPDAHTEVGYDIF